MDYNEFNNQDEYRDTEDFYDLNEDKKRKDKENFKRKAAIFGGGSLCGVLATSVICAGVMLNPVVKNIGNTNTAEASAIEANQNTDTTVTEAIQPEEAAPAAETTASTGEDLTVEGVAEVALPSCVTIGVTVTQQVQSMFGGVQEYSGEAAGSGVIIDKNDDEVLIVTNDHVVGSANQGSVTIGFCDDVSCLAEVKGTDSGNDLALVSVKRADIPDDTYNAIAAAAIGSSSDLKLGQNVVAIGNALGEGQSVTTGCISALNKDVDLQSDDGSIMTSSGLIQTEAAINSGNSGGGLFNMKGELIGINEAKASNSNGATVDNMGYAIPVDKASPILDSLRQLSSRDKVDASNAGALGIECTDVTSDASEMYGIPTGAYVASVMDGSGAQAGGLQAGDVITGFDGTSISSRTDLVNVLSYYAQGETVTITFQRASDGVYEENTAAITLGAASDLNGASGQEEIITEDDQQQGNDGYIDGGQYDQGQGNEGYIDGDQYGQDYGNDAYGYGGGDGYGFSEDDLSSIQDLFEMYGIR